MVMCQNDACYTVYDNGVYVSGQLSAEDIIAPWPETRTIKGWVNIYAHCYTGIKPTKEIADKEADGFSDERLACKYIEITYTEGEGLDA